MSIHVSTWVQTHSNAELGERLVLLILADNADEETLTCWPSVPNIAHRTRLSERQVYRCLESLEYYGRISVKRGGGRGNTNEYTILKGCQYDTLLKPDVKGDISARKGDILSTKGDICDTPILSEPSGNRQKEPSEDPPTPLPASRPVQESTGSDTPIRQFGNIQNQAESLPEAAGSDSPGQNGEPRSAAENREPYPADSLNSDHLSRLQADFDRKNQSRERRGMPQNRRYPPQSTPKVQRSVPRATVTPPKCTVGPVAPVARNGFDPKPGLEQFRARYPNIRSGDALTQDWLSVVTTPEIQAEIFSGLDRWEASAEWQRGFYADATTFLRGNGKTMALFRGKPAPYVSREERETKEEYRRLGLL